MHVHADTSTSFADHSMNQSVLNSSTRSNASVLSTSTRGSRLGPEQVRLKAKLTEQKALLVRLRAEVHYRPSVRPSDCVVAAGLSGYVFVPRNKRQTRSSTSM